MDISVGHWDRWEQYIFLSDRWEFFYLLSDRWEFFYLLSDRWEFFYWPGQYQGTLFYKWKYRWGIVPGGNNLLSTRTMALSMPEQFFIVNKYQWGRLDFFYLSKFWTVATRWEQCQESSIKGADGVICFIPVRKNGNCRTFD